jgi:isopenicillin-N N-acyltransferase like protein
MDEAMDVRQWRGNLATGVCWDRIGTECWNKRDNLVFLSIKADGFPTKKMVTEAGIIGKVGLNEAGVGVCLNAIRARELDETRLPVHLALRMALDATSAENAPRVLEGNGVGGAAHILVADRSTAIGLEFTVDRCIRLSADKQDRILHTIHLLGSIRKMSMNVQKLTHLQG